MSNSDTEEPEIVVREFPNRVELAAAVVIAFVLGVVAFRQGGRVVMLGAPILGTVLLLGVVVIDRRFWSEETERR